MYRIESLLSARLFLAPQLVGDRIFFISNLSGRLSLYAMDYGGSVPEPLLPPHIAMQNPHLIGRSFQVFPRLEKILVMLDRDGDENYQPMLIPLAGGYPEPAFGDALDNYRVHLAETDTDQNILYLVAESRSEPVNITFKGLLETGQLENIYQSTFGGGVAAYTADHSRVLIAEGYTMGDSVLFLSAPAQGKMDILYGVPLEQRQPGQEVALNGLMGAEFAPGEAGVVTGSAVFDDTYSLGYLDLAAPQEMRPVKVNGLQHHGVGEMDRLQRLKDDRYLIGYNIDGVSWLYEGSFKREKLQMDLLHVLVGQGVLANGVLESVSYDKPGDRFALAFSTASSPTQIYTIEEQSRQHIARHTNERLLGIQQTVLSDGTDASFTSFDGTRISARLYLPADELGFDGPRPLVYYIHGGPQGQERPDFAWFSMPLIQFLTLNGFAVFVPNVRGSTGYGLSYTKQVDRDWGGRDRLDHVEAMKLLKADPRLDTSRAAVVGRSYGGYMTLTLASRHPDLWQAAADMFGPYNMLTFLERMPPTWKPYFAISVGDPEKDREFLLERSPRTYVDQISCPMLVIQGKNDPRVVEAESRDLVEYLRGQGKQVEYLMFENEGHDVLKFENRVSCYNAITEFFKQHLKP